MYIAQVEINTISERIVVNVSLPHLSVLTYVFSAQWNRLIETVLLSTLNICFG